MRRSALLAPAIALLASALAGCASSPPPDPGLSATETARGVAPSLPGPLALEACRQHHTYFPARAADFQDGVPEGFRLLADEAGLLRLRVEATSCAGPVPAAMLWISAPVAPPPAYADGNASHFLAVEAYADGQGAALAWLHGAGARLAQPCSCAASEAPGPLVADRFTAEGATGGYTLQALLAPSGGTFPGFRSWTYTAVDGTLQGRFLAEGEASANRGAGTATLAYSGPGGAPPVAVAEIAHAVDGLVARLSAHPVGPAPLA